MNGEPAMHEREDGVDRRERILAELTQHMGRRVRARRRNRVAAVASVVCVLGTCAAWMSIWMSRSARPEGEKARVVVAEGERAGGQKGVESAGAVERRGEGVVASGVVVTSNDPGIVARLSVGSTPSVDVIAESVADEELLKMLEEAGVEDGLIRIGGRLQLARDLVRASVVKDGEPRSEGWEGEGGLGGRVALAGGGVG